MENTETENKVVDNLRKFGNEFQTKCVTTLITDKLFTERIVDIVELDYFEGDANKWIVKETLSYYHDYKNLPTLEVFKVKIQQITNELLKKSVIDNLRLIYKRINDTDLKFIKEQFLEFCKNQKLKNAIMDSVDYLQNGQYDKIKSTVDDAMKAGMERNLGHEYIIEVDKRMSEMSRKTIKTGWSEIDTLLDGGLGPGELGIVAAPAGIGKSWYLAKIGAAAMEQGKNVLHVTLELNENYVGLRYDCCFTGIDFQKIKGNVDVVKEALKKVPGKLHIKYFPLKTISPYNLKIHMDRMEVLTGKPDILIVDYADLLRPYSSEKGSTSYNQAGDVYEELRSIAGECGIPCWSASQCGRQSLEHDVIEANSIADSYRKIMTSDFVMSVSRKINDKTSNTARVHVMKNRFGADGITFPTMMNAGNGDIRIYHENSREGISLMNKMADRQNDAKDLLKNKWKEALENDEI